MYRTRAIVTFAALGQGRADGKLTPEEESVVITKLLTYRALQSTLFVTASCPDCGIPTSGVPHVHAKYHRIEGTRLCPKKTSHGVSPTTSLPAYRECTCVPRRGEDRCSSGKPVPTRMAALASDVRRGCSSHYPCGARPSALQPRGSSSSRYQPPTNERVRARNKHRPAAWVGNPIQHSTSRRLAELLLPPPMRLSGRFFSRLSIAQSNAMFGIIAGRITGLRG